ncbi:MAG: hypothetical protein GF333_01085 [Candidatus Omnitrophica bacterium]|nr:hypothetical protein [Candidatus Omnitrophota bacterium]
MRKGSRSVLAALLFVLLAAGCDRVPPEKVTREGSEIVIESRRYRYRAVISEDARRVRYLVYGFAPSGPSRADVLVLRYQDAERLKRRYGDMDKCTCRTACGRDLRNSLHSFAWFAADPHVKGTFRVLRGIRTIPLLSVELRRLKITEGFKKTWRGESAYRRVRVRYPYYLVTEAAVMQRDFDYAAGFK